MNDFLDRVNSQAVKNILHGWSTPNGIAIGDFKIHPTFDGYYANVLHDCGAISRVLISHLEMQLCHNIDDQIHKLTERIKTLRCDLCTKGATDEEQK